MYYSLENFHFCWRYQGIVNFQLNTETSLQIQQFREPFKWTPLFLVKVVGVGAAKGSLDTPRVLVRAGTQAGGARRSSSTRPQAAAALLLALPSHPSLPTPRGASGSCIYIRGQLKKRRQNLRNLGDEDESQGSLDYESGLRWCWEGIQEKWMVNREAWEKEEKLRRKRNCLMA